MDMRASVDYAASWIIQSNRRRNDRDRGGTAGLHRSICHVGMAAQQRNGWSSQARIFLRSLLQTHTAFACQSEELGDWVHGLEWQCYFMIHSGPARLAGPTSGTDSYVSKHVGDNHLHQVLPLIY